MYRIACRYEPSHPRMAGKSKDAQLFTRGAWRVVDAYKVSMDLLNVGGIHHNHGYPYMYIPCSRRKAPRIGTLINPRTVVNEFLAMRHSIRAAQIPKERVAA